MVQKYSVGDGKKQHGKRLFLVALLSLLIFAVLVGLFVWEVRRNNSADQQTDAGSSASEQQAQNLIVNEKQFSLVLPTGWKESARVDDKKEHSITWISDGSFQTGGELKLYIDKIPKDLAITNLLPVTATKKGKLTDGDLSDDCRSMKGAKTKRKTPQKMTWQGVTFLCDVPKANARIGTGTKGVINTTTVKSTKASHTYFFVYTDENTQPDDGALTAAVKSFQAK